MSATSSVAAADAGIRHAIVDALLRGNLLPVAPLVEIVARYALPFRSVVSCVGPEPAAKRFQSPTNVRVLRSASGDGKLSYLVADEMGWCFKQITAEGRVVSFAGFNPGFACGPARTSKFHMCGCIAVDPINPNRFYVSDSTSVRMLDQTNGGRSGGIVSLLAGAEEGGYRDGSGSRARFSGVRDFVCTSDGATLIATDEYNGRIRAVNLKTCDVTTLAGSGRDAFTVDGFGLEASLFLPRHLAFAHANKRSGVEPESILYITARHGIVRFTRSTGTEWPTATLQPAAASGFDSHGACVAGPLDGSTGQSAGYKNGAAIGKSRFYYPSGICIVDPSSADAHGPCVIVADYRNRAIRRVTLSPELFASS